MLGPIEGFREAVGDHVRACNMDPLDLPSLDSLDSVLELDIDISRAVLLE